ncbi:hypothetical protein [Gordoniibacillus kamchatkensis]|uniref:hypothetical protein n=1 Tax=Gordoniibacillus kamchatkensis TaxID=1590651 RepID=UPI00069895CD|nr:hypothetical protein [Paenibacillus sp. VKM B-2647]
MEQEKKAIVVKEIEHWRRSRLLPEHYCDFLLNLYTEQAGPKHGGGSWLGMSSSAIVGSSWRKWLLAAAVVCFVLWIGLNFTSFAISLQIGIGLLTLLSCFTFAYRCRNASPIVPNALVGAGSLFLLLVGVYLMKLNDVADQDVYAAYVAATCAVWLLTGLVVRMPIFHFSGWMGLVGSYGWLLYREFGELTWLPLQISWLPLCVLFVWAGWLLHFRAKRVGSVLFLVAVSSGSCPRHMASSCRSTLRRKRCSCRC